MIQPCTAFLLNALKNNRASEGPLQTKLLEINLLTSLQVTLRLYLPFAFHNNVFVRVYSFRWPTLFWVAVHALWQGSRCPAVREDRCIKECSCALRRFEWYQACLSSHPPSQPRMVGEFLWSPLCGGFAGVLRAMPKANIDQNLQIGVQIAPKYHQQLSTNPLIELFESFNVCF